MGAFGLRIDTSRQIESPPGAITIPCWRGTAAREGSGRALAEETIMQWKWLPIVASVTALAGAASPAFAEPSRGHDRTHEASRSGRGERGERYEREDARRERADRERHEVLAQWGARAERPDVRVELALHANRLARLDRIVELAIERRDDAMAARARDLIYRENCRHDAEAARYFGR